MANTLVKRIEQLTLQQKRDIIYFGLGARVPVDYLSEYLHVDEKTVKKVLNEYKREYQI